VSVGLEEALEQAADARKEREVHARALLHLAEMLRNELRRLARAALDTRFETSTGGSRREVRSMAMREASELVERLCSMAAAEVLLAQQHPSLPLFVDARDESVSCGPLVDYSRVVEHAVTCVATSLGDLRCDCGALVFR